MMTHSRNVVVTEEGPRDAEEIHSVTAEAFCGQVDTCGREAEIVDELRSGGALSVSLVARCDARILGHVAASPIECASKESGWYGIGPVSVHPEFQRKGIGSMLMNAALSRLREMGARGCVLVGHPEYYRRFGFQTDGSASVSGVPREVTHCLKFRECGDPGEVTFHKAFGIP
jgi:putative acetyltransferase